VPTFLLLQDADQNPLLYNLDQIVLVSECRPGHCLITFANNLVVTLNGADADRLTTDLVSCAQLTDGTSAGEWLEKVLERRKQAEKIGNSAPSKVSTIDGSKSQS
jgi:hypothetical protein